MNPRLQKVWTRRMVRELHSLCPPLAARGIGGSLCLAALMFAACASARSASGDRALRFFEGSTESVSTMKIMAQKPFVSRSVGRGKIREDGTLELMQHVSEEGRREFDRHWQIRQVAPGRFAGSMSEAIGPIAVEKVGNRYVFRFGLKGHLSVEQWVTPDPDMISARTRLTVRKFGIAVAH